MNVIHIPFLISILYAIHNMQMPFARPTHNHNWRNKWIEFIVVQAHLSTVSFDLPKVVSIEIALNIYQLTTTPAHMIRQFPKAF